MCFAASVVALAMLAPPAGASQPRAEPDPVAVVTAFYERDSIRAYEFYSARLEALFVEDERRASGEAGNLDFAFHVNAQDAEDGWEKSPGVGLLARGPDRAVVRVTFRNFQPQEIHFTLVREQGRWLIDDAKSVAGVRWVLSEILKGAR